MMSISIASYPDEALRAEINRLLPQLSSSAPELTHDDLVALLASNAITLFVARDEDRVVGMLTLAMFPLPTGRRAWIEDVVVDAEARGRGIGEELTTTAVAHAQRHGARTVDLTSRPSREAANALYQKVGFVQRATNVYRIDLD